MNNINFTDNTKYNSDEFENFGSNLYKNINHKLPFNLTSASGFINLSSADFTLTTDNNTTINFKFQFTKNFKTYSEDLTSASFTVNNKTSDITETLLTTDIYSTFLNNILSLI